MLCLFQKIKKIKTLILLWFNPIFNHRYVLHNYLKGVHFSPLSFKEITRKIKQNPFKLFYLIPFYFVLRFLDELERHFKIKFKNNYKFYIFWRLFKNKIDIPYFELVLTTRCTLNCESCNNLMQYFNKEKAYTASLNGILETLNALFNQIDTVRIVRVIGGEPLIFKHLAELVDFLNQNQKVITFDIVTNATLLPNEKLLKAMQRAKNKMNVSISDYSLSPNLNIPLKQKQLQNLLKEYAIPFQISLQNKDDLWIDPGRIYPRKRNKKEIVENFKNCLMSCVSVMSNEGLNHFPGGGLFLCPIASSLSRLENIQQFEGDFVLLNEHLTDYDLLAFYAQDFFKCCDYCHDMKKPKKYIPIAIQTKEVLKIENPRST